MNSKTIVIEIVNSDHALSIIKEARKQKVRYTQIKYYDRYNFQMKPREYQNIKNMILNKSGIVIFEKLISQ